MIDLAANTIFVTLAGSHAHGTARPDSDLDLRGVCTAPLPLRLSLFEDFEQFEGVLPGTLATLVRSSLESEAAIAAIPADQIECVIYDIGKFLSLCARTNPNALEILFADERDWLYETPRWRTIHSVRHRFLTRKIQHTFLGYALSQLKRIETHRSWLLKPPKKKPRREDFGLPDNSAALSRDDQHRIERSIAEKMRSYGIEELDLAKADRIAVQGRMETFYRDALSDSATPLDPLIRSVASRALALPSDVTAALESERRYRAAMKNWSSYETWKKHRNRSRAALEREHGYDTKHALHLIRLMRMGLEALEAGTLSVRRADADELSAIYQGSLSFDELLEEANALQAGIHEASRRSELPPDVDPQFVDDLLLEVIETSS